MSKPNVKPHWSFWVVCVVNKYNHGLIRSQTTLCLRRIAWSSDVNRWEWHISMLNNNQLEVIC